MNGRVLSLGLGSLMPFFCCLACGESNQAQNSQQALALLDASAWVESENQGAVPLPDEYLSRECRPGGWGEENDALEVDTGLCPVVDLAQPSLSSAQEGQRLRIEWWHQDLAALSPGQGVIALSVKDKIIWQREVQIPSAAAAYTDEVELNIGFDQGDVIHFHLHNHGANSWNLYRVELIQ